MVSNRRSPQAKRGTASVAALNLNGKRAERAEVFAARREEQGKGGATELPIFFGVDADGRDRLIAELGPELPLEVFAPLLEMELDLPALIVQIMQAAESPEGQNALMETLVGVLYTYPSLPTELLATVQKVGCNLLTPEGFEAFIAEHPSHRDVGALAEGLMDWYGIDLGKLLGSSPSAIDGGTSGPTSPTTTPASSSAESGDSRESLAS